MPTWGITVQSFLTWSAQHGLLHKKEEDGKAWKGALELCLIDTRLSAPPILLSPTRSLGRAL